MKNFYRISLLLLLVVSSNSFSQVNIYLDNNPVWQVKSMCSAPAPCIQEEDYNYYVQGDTILSGITYRKIFRKGMGIYSWFAPFPPAPGCTGTYSYINTTSDHFIRSSGLQMYIRTTSDTAEYLLYDFDLQVGDSLPVAYTNYETGILVTAIDSFATPYGFRKRFSLSGNTWSQELLEGIGHSKGLLEPMNVPLECGFELTCFSLNDTAYYPVTGPTCELALTIPEIPDATSQIYYYPNPSNGIITFNPMADFKNATFIVYDVQQRIILEQSGISGNKFEFKNEKLDDGIYLFKIVDANQNLSGKLVFRK